MARRTKSSPMLNTVIGIVVLIIGLFTIGKTVSTKKVMEKCTSTVQGEVTSVSRVRHSKKSGKRRRTYYTYTTYYSYEVDGKRYTGSVSLGESNRLSEGSSINVSYEPAHPDNNCTSYARSQNTNGYVSGGFMILLGVVFTGSGIKSKRRGNTLNDTARAAIPFAAGMDNNYNSNFNNYNNNYNSNNFNNGYNNNFGGGYDNSNNYNNGYGNNNGYSNFGGYQDNGIFGNDDFNQLN